MDESPQIRKHLEIAGAVQSLLLPKSDSHRTEKFELAGYFRPARQTGGDWWWHGTDHAGRALMAVGDVTGHDVGSAMVTAVVAGIFHTLAKQVKAGTMSVTQLIHELNANLHGICEGKYWLSITMLTADPVTRQLECWAAGMPPVMLLNGKGGIRLISALGSPLGTQEVQLGYKKTELATDERIFVSTDGIPDMELPSGKRLGTKMLAGALKQVSGLPLVEAREKFAENLKELRGERLLDDDLTFVFCDLL